MYEPLQCRCRLRLDAERLDARGPRIHRGRLGTAAGGVLLSGWHDCSNVICEEQPPSEEPLLEFSLDIGSDTELSDPYMDGDEVFDPGDVYSWVSPPLTPPGRNGFKDDAQIFGVDPTPDPLIPSRVPVGNVTSPPNDPSQWYPNYFDLDGHDQIDIYLEEYIPPEEPLPVPIPQQPSNCIHEPIFLYLTFDDDQAPGWMQVMPVPPNGDVPVTAPSPVGLLYGMTLAQDEVVSAVLPIGGPWPVPAPPVNPFRNEVGVHVSMAPNPDNGEMDDDDVDSLDIVPHMPDGQACPFWYFTADHEASMGLDPGSIYVMPGGPVKVIDQVIHLGLVDNPATQIIEDADIDAFEFTWLAEDEGAPPVLAILFSVDEDDPLTPGVDESGGLNPTVLYASFMMGWSFQVTLPFQDDIDGLAIWTEELPPNDVVPPNMTSAVSRKLHGGVNQQDIDLLAPLSGYDVAVECRVNGPTDVHVWFDEPIYGVGGLDPSDVNIKDTSGATIIPSALSIAGNELIIAMSGAADPGRVSIRFPGIQDAAGNIVSSSVVLCFGVLTGDTTGDGAVNIFDLVAVRNALGTSPVTPATCRRDITADNAVNIFDLVAVRNNLGKSCPGPGTCP